MGIAIALADWTIYLIPVAMTVAWVRGDDVARRELLQMLVSTLIALWIAQVITHLWPRPRPFALHLGTQYLAHADDPGLPSDHVTVLWSLALAAFGTKRFAVWGLPLLTLGFAGRLESGLSGRALSIRRAGGVSGGGRRCCRWLSAAQARDADGHVHAGSLSSCRNLRVGEDRPEPPPMKRHQTSHTPHAPAAD